MLASFWELAMRINKVVTKVGDGGTTRLVGNIEVPKDHVRIHCYGTVDELNGVIGMASAELARATDEGVKERQRVGLEETDRALLSNELVTLQHQLFDLGADLATPVSKRWESFKAILAADTDHLEERLNRFNDDLPPLEEFVLPGGGPVGATLHLARTVCRRAERYSVTLVREEGDEVNRECARFLNRLSDHLFVLARWAAVRSHWDEVLWRAR